ncbi:MAG: hypothetical protein CO066_03380 [Comamonadaceae bacterium CG_4_9_14_0_8_um_filter_60_18]|nr:MAG: hypothetical protein COW39_08540 [Comamonadaceae bacterium CG17_big_fil_post_rev_8_21_14_2_50_60_13]PJC15983.1 MAG: hypothetical protein CO066_03380 [Comamonadaceae bacterium CG_4_9_14_0_8_um_filter_60_18]
MPQVSTSEPVQSERLEALLGFYGQYHNHKEQMAFSVFGLEGAFFVGLFLLGNWPQTIESMNRITLSWIFVLVWVLFHLALRYQLRNRRLAAIMVAAYYDALTQKSDLVFERSRHTVVAASKIAQFADLWLLPVRGALRPSDVELAELVDGAKIRPATLSSYQYHLLKHKNLAAKSWTSYALPIEWITSLGSIVLLAIALLRVLQSVPKSL